MQQNNTTLQPKVSIVIPVYKAEKYIGRCVRTLFSQTCQNGVDAATGEYIIHCDPDDCVEPDMYEQLFQPLAKI